MAAPDGTSLMQLSQNVKGDKDTQTKSKVDKQSRLSLTGNTPSQVQAIEDWIQGKGILEGATSTDQFAKSNFVSISSCPYHLLMFL